MEDRIYRIPIQQLSEDSAHENFYNYFVSLLSAFTFRDLGEKDTFYLPSNNYGDGRKKLTKIIVKDVGDYLEVKITSKRWFPRKWEKQLFKVLDELIEAK